MNIFAAVPVISGPQKDMKKEKLFWLVSTEHLENRLWFRDDEDFKTGMNYVAAQAASSYVSVLAFILMSNHVHFVLFGTHEETLAFANSFKMRFARFVRRKYGQKEFLRRNCVDLRVLSRNDEGVERGIAYVHMNSVAANICSAPNQYQWGSGNVLFKQLKPEGRRLGSVSERERKRLLHCSVEMPSHWLLGHEGYILPSSFVARKEAEIIFHTPKRMNYFLSSSSKARKMLVSKEDSMPSFRDQIVVAAVPDLCRTLFGRESLDGLEPYQIGEVLRQIRYRFSSNVDQIARVAGLSYSEAARLLDQMHLSSQNMGR